jgi:uncharacterized iron-regulated membrane protein
MELFRKIIFWCHLTTGVIGGIIVLIMSVTGVLLMYEKQIILWADTRNYRAEPPSGATRLPVEALINRVQQSQPDAVPATITLRSDPAYPATLSYAGGRNVFVNPYTGDIWGEGSKGVRDFFRTMTDWHRWLGAQGENRTVARAITGACNLGFLFLVISGFYLWFPKKLKWSQIRNVIWFKRGLASKARDFNWHNVIGFWSVVPLFIVVLSAVVISYVWAGNLVYRIAGEAPPAPRPAAPPPAQQQGSQTISIDGIDSLWSRAEQQVSDWQSINLRLPTSADAPLVFTIDQGSGGQPQKRGTLTLDRATGETRLWEPFSSLTTGRKLRSILRFAHTGEVAGIIGQTIAGIASAGGAVLVWTGIALAWRRFRAWMKRRSGATIQTVPQMAEEAIDAGVGND